MLRLLVDEGISKSTISLLRNLGNDVVSVYDIGLEGADDPVVVKYAQREKRVIVTLGKEFGELYYFSSGKNLGVIVLRDKPLTVENINSSLERLFKSERIKKVDPYTSLFIVRKYRIRYLEKGK